MALGILALERRGMPEGMFLPPRVWLLGPR